MSAIDRMLELEEQILHEAARSRVAYVPALIWLGLTLWPGSLIGLLTGVLALTDRRVLGRVGLFRRRLLAVRHAQVELVRVQQGLIGTLFDYGSVTIITKDNRRFTMRGVVSPRETQREIDEAVELAVLGRKLSDVVPPDVALPAPKQVLMSRALEPITMPVSVQAVDAAPRKKPDPNMW